MPNLSAIKQIDKLLNEDVIKQYIPYLSHPLVSDIVSKQVDLYRKSICEQNEEVDLNLLMQKISSALLFHKKQRLQRVINATGILVHTNFGRAALSKSVWREAEDVVCHYSNLEQDLNNGKRGNRMGLLPELIRTLCGAEDSLLINNNAAALYLLLRTFAFGKEVLVSRGEQVQIGGGFRIPEILAESGAILRDVGTTNITTVDDYLNAINENTAIVLLVHTSNYFIEGFTKRVSTKDLAKCLPKNILLVIDQGSGNQHDWLTDETTVARHIKSGADLVCFSTDKMLGGPQGGIISGHKNLIQQLNNQPIMRAFRPSKISYALLELMLLKHLNKNDINSDRITFIINQKDSWHKERAERIASFAPNLTNIVPANFLIGGGTTPRKNYPTWAVELNNHISDNTWLENLRNHNPAIIGVSHRGHALIYPVTLFDDDFICIKNFLCKEPIKLN